jgi:phosphate transport system substrate-binding protein
MASRVLRSIKLLPLLAAFGLLVAACAPGEEEPAAPGEQDALEGSIVVDGSSTVAPITEAIAEEFRADAPGVSVTVATSGTGGGFEKFCAGETDINNASRAIDEEEIAACAAAGVEYTSFLVGLDGLAIITSNENPFLERLTIEQLASIFKAGGATTWDQVDPTFPNERIRIFAPDIASGTYDFFVDEVLDEGEARTDYTHSADDNVLARGVAGERYSWGFFGFAFYDANRDTVRAIEVCKDGTCVLPTHETVTANEYPLSRPLYIYVNNEALARAEVQGFVRFYLETVPGLITEVGYTPAPEADYQEGLARLEEIAAGS